MKRVHVNLGHPDQAALLRALRISRASEAAIKACRLFRCPDCPRLHQRPQQPRPSKLPISSDFNVQIGLDVLYVKDSGGSTWSWLNILCQGTTFQVCALLGEVHMNPTSSHVLEIFTSHWLTWAGYPEHGVLTDRAKYVLADFAEDMAAHGCHFEAAARASPWQLGQIELHGNLWKKTMQKLIWSQQVSGRKELLMARSATNQAKNSMSRKGGFSPQQWVIGREIRLPAALSDEGEVARIGAQALAETPETTFYRKNQIRFAAREVFARMANAQPYGEQSFGRLDQAEVPSLSAPMCSTSTHRTASQVQTAGEE